MTAKALRSFEKAFSKIEKAGDPQWTRGAYGAQHAARSENLVREVVKNAGIKNVDNVYYNKSINTILPGVDINKLPDAVVRLKNGDYTLIEVVSPSQTAVSQIEKFREMARQLGNKTGRKVDWEIDDHGAKGNASSGGNGGSNGGNGSGGGPSPCHAWIC